jgi:hypothetical protein
MFTVVARFAHQLFTDRGPRTAAILPASGAGPAPLDAGGLSRLRLDVGRRVSYTWKFRTIGSPFVRKWRNWQTRKPQELVAARSWRFKSSLPQTS